MPIALFAAYTLTEFSESVFSLLGGGKPGGIDSIHGCYTFGSAPVGEEFLPCLLYESLMKLDPSGIYSRLNINKWGGEG